MFSIEHHTRYHFDRPVWLGKHLIRLRPAPHYRASISAYSLTVSTQKVRPCGPQENASYGSAHADVHSIDWLNDSFGNHVAQLAFVQPVSGFSLDIGLELEIAMTRTLDWSFAESAGYYPFEYAARLRPELAPYQRIAESGPLLTEWLTTLHLPHGARCHVADYLAEVNRRVCDRVGYRIRMHPGVQNCEQTLGLQNGSCRDSAWLLVQVLRHLGFAARFVSGYLLQPIDVLSPEAGDSVELHAWAEVYLPDAGWIGLDATSGLFSGDGHIPLACAPEPLAAAPVSGRVGKCAIMLEFHTAVSRIN